MEFMPSRRNTLDSHREPNPNDVKVCSQLVANHAKPAELEEREQQIDAVGRGNLAFDLSRVRSFSVVSTSKARGGTGASCWTTSSERGSFSHQDQLGLVFLADSVVARELERDRADRRRTD